MSRSHVCAASMFVLTSALAAGCLEQRGLRWELDVADDAVRDRIVLVRAEIRLGTCAETGERIYTAEPSLGGTVPRVPTLAEGTYAFAATARDARCVVIASGCEDVTLPADPGSVVRTVLIELAPTPPICTDCAEGRCTGERDAGNDASGEDAFVIETPDASFDGGGLGLPPPRLIAPWNGFASGSIHASTSGVTRAPLRPRFAWERVSGAARYEVQVDDGCVAGPPSACDFARGRMLTSTSSGRASGAWTFVPTEDLVTTAARVHWRVRACDAGGMCGPWSPEVRWMDVGRDRHDVDGDGRGDLVIGAPGEDGDATDAGAVYLTRGDASAPFASVSRLAIPSRGAGAWLGHAISLGDLDGDGLADAVVSASSVEDDGTTAGAVIVLRGDATTGLDVSSALTITAPDGAWSRGFGVSVAIVDDTDGDGFRDVLVGAAREGLVGRAYLFRGDPSSVVLSAPSATFVDPEASASSRFGMVVAPAYDVDGDGACDLAIGAPFSDAGGTDRGRAWIVRMATPSAPIALTGASDSYTYFGYAISGAGDVNEDGYADVVVGSPYEDFSAVSDSDEGRAYVFGGARDGVASARVLATLARSEGYNYVHAGWSIAAGDVDGDGHIDVVLPEPAIDDGTGVRDTGVVIVHPGVGDGSFGTPVQLHADVEQEFMTYGRSVAVIDGDGDGRGELISSAHRWNSVSSEDTGRVYRHDDPLGAATLEVIASPVETGGAMFGWALPDSIGHLPVDPR